MERLTHETHATGIDDAGLCNVEGSSKKPTRVRSVSRSLAILQAINLAGSLSLTEIARAVGLPYATAGRIVFTLIHEGMIESEPDRRRYRPTALVQSLASGYQDQRHLGAVARPHILALTERHGCAVAVSTRLGLNMIVRECTHAVSHFTLSAYYPGFDYPLIKSAAGLVYLAHADAREQQLTRQALELSSDIAPDDLNFICEAALEDVRRNGFGTRSRNRFTLPEGKNSGIAAPIFHQGQLNGTVALIFLASSMRMDKAVALYAQDVIDTAAAIGRDLDRVHDESLGRPPA